MGNNICKTECVVPVLKGLCSCGGIVTVKVPVVDYVFYTGPNLGGTGIKTNDEFNTVIQKIDAKILQISQQIYDIQQIINQ